MREGAFREDLYARLSMWRFHLPGLKDRREDIAANIDYELERFGQQARRNVRFNAEALRAYLRFAQAPEALWRANFRDLSASIRRMATLAHEGRINEDLVHDEIERLKIRWRTAPLKGDPLAKLHELMGSEAVANLDLFEFYPVKRRY